MRYLLKYNTRISINEKILLSRIYGKLEICKKKVMNGLPFSYSQIDYRHFTTVFEIVHISILDTSAWFIRRDIKEHSQQLRCNKLRLLREKNIILSLDIYQKTICIILRWWLERTLNRMLTCCSSWSLVKDARKTILWQIKLCDKLHSKSNSAV